MRHLLALILPALLIVGCNRGGKAYDATGTFETTEVTVSAEQSGRLLTFTLTEGDSLAFGQQVGLVDTTQLSLRALQLGATSESYASQRPDIEKQIASTKQELAKAEMEQKRYETLVREHAANQQQLDDAESSVKVLRRQLDAQLSSLSKNTSSLNSQMTATDIERMQVLDQLRKCRVTAPLSGVVLAKYAEEGEYAVPGTPLFKMADVAHMFLRAYVTTAQLQSVRVGQDVTVFADYGDGNRREYKGKVSWISDQAEFTPKTILTDDERADLVYAVKIAVLNDGYIKIGMYGEVAF
ncbi:MAG: efflux RND transporter periplasmic adaptor subunit [Prevotellaceae bacterium]|nr:efflux RND transporter periplasmic adaptor subunit [Prevotellaceae bacterium]